MVPDPGGHQYCVSPLPPWPPLSFSATPSTALATEGARDGGGNLALVLFMFPREHYHFSYLPQDPPCSELQREGAPNMKPQAKPSAPWESRDLA